MMRLGYLWFKVYVGRGHLGYFKDAHGQRDGAQDKQAVIDQDPRQDRMPDIPITGDRKVINIIMR